MAQHPVVDQGLPIIDASRPHSETPHSVRPFLTSDQPLAEISTWQRTTLIRYKLPCHRRDSNPQSQRATGIGL